MRPQKGAPPHKGFMLQGHEVRVVDGVCVNADGALAGSDLDMATAVRNAAAMLAISIETAVSMASRHPAAFLRLDQSIGRIAGYRGDLVSVDDDMSIVRTWIGGEARSPAQTFSDGARTSPV